MQYTEPFNRLAIFAQTTLVFTSAYRILPILKDKYSYSSSSQIEKGERTYQWVLSCIKDIIVWIENQEIDGKTFHKEKLSQSVDYVGYYHHLIQSKENAALEVCYNTIAFSCLSMLKYDQIQNIYTKSYFPSDLEFTSDIFEETLLYAQQASENPKAEKAWQDQIIARLLKDHFTENPDDFGENISREYIEELLGEKLPF
ncbi:MAG: hypothetical protein HC880_00615 [Bacteroidia bacterium]|nr:hypothetical protein [Bacteroidia bacterium]